MAINKVVYGNNTLIDLSSDTVSASDVLVGKYFTGPDGVRAEGECSFDADTSDATATAGSILADQTAYVAGNKITGTMPNRAGASGTIASKNGSYTIQSGYHDGSGTVTIDTVEKNKLIAGNIKKDVTILGVTGTFEGQGAPVVDTLSVTPYTTAKTYTPPEGVDGYNEIQVAAIYYNETVVGRGTTVTIGTVAPS